jgi:hypothetical protein
MHKQMRLMHKQIETSATGRGTNSCGRLMALLCASPERPSTGARATEVVSLNNPIQRTSQSLPRLRSGLSFGPRLIHIKAL